MPTLDDILSATKPTDLFSGDLDEKTAYKRYQRLLRIAHPDLNAGRKEDAAKAFNLVNELWKRVTNKADAPHTASNTIRTKRHEFQFEAKRYQIDGTVYYNATYDAGHKEAFIAFSASAGLNAMFLDGTRNLMAIRKEAPDEVKGFLPEVFDSFLFHNGTAQVSAVALKTEESFKDMFSLRDVLVDYPKGIHAKDVAWMFRRMLIALSLTHKAGFVHAGAYIDAFMIHPERHGLVLKDWQYSVKIGEPAKMLSRAAINFYPEEVSQYKPLTPKVDIRLAAKAALDLLEDDSAPRLARALHGIYTYPPESADKALQEFDELLKELWGERKWHEFKMKRIS